MVKGVGGNSISAKGFALMKLTIGCKTLATAFFVAEVQGNYSLILGREWIHSNRCVPSSLHRFLIQWVNNEVEIIHADSSAYTMADAPLLGGHDDMICLSGRHCWFTRLCSYISRVDWWSTPYHHVVKIMFGQWFASANSCGQIEIGITLRPMHARQNLEDDYKLS